MQETPFYFPDGERSLFGILHRPSVDQSLPAYVFCHPFAEEKLWTHRVFVTFARQLAAGGHPVLRFDLMGNGDSEGAFSESSLATAISGVRRAVEQVRELAGDRPVNLMGLRLGATVASLVAEEVPGIQQLVLWAPIVDGARYMQELLRINLATQMAVHKEIRQDRVQLVETMRQGETLNVDGYDMALPLYEQVSAVTLASNRKRFKGLCLIVQVDRQPGRPSAELQQLAASYERATLVSTQEEPFWKEIPQFYQEAPNLFAVTLDWLRRGDGRSAVPD
jgi:uncharacterized protein